jgi:hypothetical protein
MWLTCQRHWTGIPAEPGHFIRGPELLPLTYHDAICVDRPRAPVAPASSVHRRPPGTGRGRHRPRHQPRSVPGRPAGPGPGRSRHARRLRHCAARRRIARGSPSGPRPACGRLVRSGWPGRTVRRPAPPTATARRERRARAGARRPPVGPRHRAACLLPIARLMMERTGGPAGPRDPEKESTCTFRTRCCCCRPPTLRATA